MQSITILELIEKYNNTKDEQTFNVIFEYFTPLLRKVSTNKFAEKYHNELIDVCRDTLPKALRAYKPEKGSKITTYIYSYCYKYCKHYVKQLEKQISTDNIDSYINVYAPEIDLDLRMDIEYLLNTTLTPIEIKIIKMKYGFEGYKQYSFSEINEILQMKSSFYYHNKALDKLRKTDYIKNFKN